MILSLTLLIGWIWCVRRLVRFRPLWARTLFAVAAFWLFVRLSPQLYYLYYLLISTGLPMQNVIQAPPALPKLAQLLAFRSNATLSAHAQAILGWGMILVAILKSPQRSELTAP